MVQKLIILFFIAILSGCSIGGGVNEGKDFSLRHLLLKEKQEIEPSFFNEQVIKSISMKQEDFNTVLDWYDQETVLYLKNSAGLYSVRKYHLFSGKDELFYETNEPIIDVKANRSHQLFSIHIASNAQQAKVDFVGRTGESKYTWQVESSELELTWSPYEDTTLLATAFFEDWEYQVYQLNVSKQTVSDLQVPNPFVQWKDASTIYYLDWGQDSMALSAPLYQYEIKSGKNKKIQDNVNQFFAFRNIYVVILQDDSEKSRYLFYDSNTDELINEVDVPVLRSESEFFWVPNHVYYEQRGAFSYFSPKHSDELYRYTDGFQLKTYNIFTGKTETLINLAENVRLKSSPNGQYLLIGNQLENIMDLKTNQLIRLVEQS